MPISILAGIVVGGVSLVLLLLYLVGWTKDTQIQDHNQAQRVFKERYHDEQVTSVTLDDHQKIAVLELQSSDKFGLVAVFGDKLVVRLLAKGILKQVEQEESSLLLKTNDFTFPKIKIAINDSNACSALNIKLTALL
jgi:hypothetical protein